MEVVGILGMSLETVLGVGKRCLMWMRCSYFLLVEGEDEDYGREQEAVEAEVFKGIVAVEEFKEGFNDE